MRTMLNHPYLIEEHLRQREQELPRSAAVPAWPAPPAAPAGVGGGLIGMQERIHAYGGDVP